MISGVRAIVLFVNDFCQQFYRIDPVQCQWRHKHGHYQVFLFLVCRTGWTHHPEAGVPFRHITQTFIFTGRWFCTCRLFNIHTSKPDNSGLPGSEGVFVILPGSCILASAETALEPNINKLIVGGATADRKKSSDFWVEKIEIKMSQLLRPLDSGGLFCIIFIINYPRTEYLPWKH